MIQTQIRRSLEELVAAQGITILYACESGSRAWGFASPDSDYDVRFIYRHPVDWYLSIEEKKDTIELPVDALLDIGGWDLRKTLQLLKKSNPVIFEWLQSPIVYHQEPSFQAELFALAQKCFSPKTAMYHYLAGAKNALANGVEGEMVKVKSYFYVLRQLLAAKWIAETGCVPPMEFSKLFPLCSEQKNLCDEINELLAIKKRALEKEKTPARPIIQDFIQTELINCEAIAAKIESRLAPVDELNRFLYEKAIA